MKRLFGIIVGLLIMILPTTFMLIYNSSTKDYVSVDATVVSSHYIAPTSIDEDASYMIELEYTANGDKYVAKMDFSEDHAIGETMTIRYNPTNPLEVTTVEINGTVMIIACTATVIIGAITILQAIRKS